MSIVPHLGLHIPGWLFPSIIFGGMLLVGLVAWSRFTKHDTAVRIRRGYPIHAYVGPNGGGKSLAMVRDTLPTMDGVWWSCEEPAHYHTQQGITEGPRLILSTVEIHDPDADVPATLHRYYVPLTDYRQLVTAEHCDVLLDEVTGVASSRTSAGMPAQVANMLVQLRRRDVLLRWTAPAWARADTIIRECSQAVTDCRGLLPENLGQRPLTFDGPHNLCDTEGVHSHPSGVMWRPRRLFSCRTYDATLFEDWTNAKREKLRAVCRERPWWRPGSRAERAYSTLRAVSTLGVVSDAGLCMDCGGKRSHRSCTCDRPHLSDADRAARRVRSARLRTRPEVEPIGRASFGRDT